MIKSFTCKETKNIFDRRGSKKLPISIQKFARRKLIMINQAAQIKDLKSPPGNFLEKLIGERKGQYSVRINKQWRICFRWLDDNAEEVQIVDYH